MGSVVRATANIFFSLLLGAIAFAIIAVKSPATMFAIQDIAEQTRLWLTTRLGIPVEYNVWVRFLIQDQQLVFMFFVVVTRILLATTLSLVSNLLSSSDSETMAREDIAEAWEQIDNEKRKLESERRKLSGSDKTPASSGSINNLG